MSYGALVLRRGMSGEAVAELQLRLAGFRGTVPDGDFGPGTELQVVTFQRDYMGLEHPTGIADGETLRAIDRFADEFPLDFELMKCPCGQCGGFGNGRYRGEYWPDKPRIEQNYRYEYPGMHRMLLWAARAVMFYHPHHEFTISSGYRCSIDNEQKGRRTTNHHGKAVDLDIVLKPGETQEDDRRFCDRCRGDIVNRAHAQIGWLAQNRKALEPSDIAPTWVHYDVRCYESCYLTDDMFCTSREALDQRVDITAP